MFLLLKNLNAFQALKGEAFKERGQYLKFSSPLGLILIFLSLRLFLLKLKIEWVNKLELFSKELVLGLV